MCTTATTSGSTTVASKFNYLAVIRAPGIRVIFVVMFPPPLHTSYISDFSSLQHWRGISQVQKYPVKSATVHLCWFLLSFNNQSATVQFAYDYLIYYPLFTCFLCTNKGLHSVSSATLALQQTILQCTSFVSNYKFLN